MTRCCLAICCLVAALSGFGFAENLEGPQEGRREIGKRWSRRIDNSESNRDRTAYPVTRAEQVSNQRHHLIDALKQLQNDYTKAGMLDEALVIRRQIRALEKHARITLPPVSGAAPSTPVPGAMPPATPASEVPETASPDVNGFPEGFGTEIGRSYFVPVVGRTTGTVWGDGPYTTDSDLASAAVHAGVVKDGHAAVLRVTVLPGESSYESSTSHGVTTYAWQSYPSSFRIDGAGESISTAYHLRGESVEVVTVHVVGRTTGPVWGTDDYTDDSDIATAAVHAGLVKAGEEALILLTPGAGREAYSGSERNRIRSTDYGRWGGSYRLQALPNLKTPDGSLVEVLRGITNLEEWRGQSGTRLHIEVTGQAGGAVYGTDLYTTDSSVASAAVHAGLVEVGQTAILTVEIAGEQTGFISSTRNGVSSSAWQTWGSYRFVPPASAGPVDEGNRKVRILQRETISITGKTTGVVWGTDIYTDDSDLGTAAVHAGRLKEGETANLTIEFIEAPTRHRGSDRNGVQTRDWNSTWQRSFRFADPVLPFGQPPRRAPGVHFF